MSMGVLNEDTSLFSLSSICKALGRGEGSQFRGDHNNSCLDNFKNKIKSMTWGSKTARIAPSTDENGEIDQFSAVVGSVMEHFAHFSAPR